MCSQWVSFITPLSVWTNKSLLVLCVREAGQTTYQGCPLFMCKGLDETEFFLKEHMLLRLRKDCETVTYFLKSCYILLSLSGPSASTFSSFLSQFVGSFNSWVFHYLANSLNVNFIDCNIDCQCGCYCCQPAIAMIIGITFFSPVLTMLVTISNNCCVLIVVSHLYAFPIPWYALCPETSSVRLRKSWTFTLEASCKLNE